MSLQSTRQRWAQHANQARALAQSELTDPSIRLQGITTREAFIGRTWGEMPNEYGIHWDWFRMWDAYRRDNPRMLDLSMYYGSALSGLALASPNKNKTYIGLDYIQGVPGTHDLRGKVVPITLLVMRHYARLIDATVLRILNPLPEVTSYYGSMGFTMVNQSLGLRAASYMEMEL